MFTLRAGSGSPPIPFDLQIQDQDRSIKKLTALNFQNESLSLGEKLQTVLARIPTYEHVEPTQRRIVRDEVTTIKDCDIEIYHAQDSHQIESSTYKVSIRNQQSFYTRMFTILTDTISLGIYGAAPFTMITYALGLLSNEGNVRDLLTCDPNFLQLAPRFTFSSAQRSIVLLTKTDAEKTKGEFLRLVLSRIPAYDGELDIHIEDADHSRLYNVELRRQDTWLVRISSAASAVLWSPCTLARCITG